MKVGFARMEPVFRETMVFGKDLASDDSISEDTRGDIRKDVDELQGRWEAFLLKLDDETERCILF